MIIEMAASTILSLGTVTTQGASDTARFVAEEAERGRRQLQNSFSFGLGGKGVYDELYSVVDRYLVGDWDGYGASPLNAKVYAQACQFLRALPLGIAPLNRRRTGWPLTLEWYRSPRRLLSVSISPEGICTTPPFGSEQGLRNGGVLWGCSPPDLGLDSSGPSRMTSSERPPAVTDEELLARFLLFSRWVREDRTLRPDGCMPSRDAELSVTRHRGLSEMALWQIGHIIADARPSATLYGRADLKAVDARRQRLRVDAAPLPAHSNHAIITGWPPEKPPQKSVAIELAASATFVARE
jgi:hypothetical protein